MSLGRFLASQFRQPSGWFGSLVAGRLMNFANRRIVDSTLALLAPQPQHRVLDVGFGGGYGLARLAELLTDGTVSGVDLAPDMVREAERRFRQQIAQGRLQVQLGDVSRLPFPAETFDRVLTINTIYFWPDVPQGLSEILRVLKKNGRAAVSIRSKDKMEKVAFTKHGFRLFSPDDVAALMREAGFRDVRIDHRDSDRLYDQAIVLGTRP